MIEYDELKVIVELLSWLDGSIIESKEYRFYGCTEQEARELALKDWGPSDETNPLLLTCESV